MNETPIQLVQPLAYRVWDSNRHSFFYTDALPNDDQPVDRWTGYFDRQGTPLYENDIIRVHHDWKLGWVRALIVRDSARSGYRAEATGPQGEVLRIGFYCFADAYRLGNLRENPARLIAATEQFPQESDDRWWLSSAAFRPVVRTCLN